MVPEETVSGGESFHTILVTHGVLGGGTPNGDPPNDEDGGPSRGGPCNNGPPKSSQHVSYPNWYSRLVAPTPHVTQKSLSYFIYKDNTNPNVHVQVFQKAICVNG
jgi:hypothetical protein